MRKDMEYAFLFIILFIGIMIILLKKKNSPGKTVVKKYKYQDFIEAAGSFYDIPPERIFGHMMQESSGNPNCIGKIGERGLMQVRNIAYLDVQKNFPEFKEINFSMLWDAEINIKAGTAYLSLCRKWVGGNLDLASQAYNVGIGNVKKNPDYGLAYLEKVKNYEVLV